MDLVAYTWALTHTQHFTHYNLNIDDDDDVADAAAASVPTADDYNGDEVDE